MKQEKVYSAIGMMSGTSLDGVDIALLRTDGLAFVEPQGFKTISYSDEERKIIRAAFGERDAHSPKARAAAAVVTDAHIRAVQSFAHKADIIGFHGQTLFHAPDERLSIQVGDSALLARRTGMDVVGDFRQADIAAGGQGAPLAPLYHQAIAQSKGADFPAAFLNIGGVGNVTYISNCLSRESGNLDGEHKKAPVSTGAADFKEILAFDTGPGNALMDDWMLEHTGRRYDEDGALAATGTPDMAIVRRWLSHEYFDRKPPKSLDRDHWDIAAMGAFEKDLEGMDNADAMASLLAFTLESIARSIAHMPKTPKIWYVCGGGRHNKTLMAGLRQRLNMHVHDIADIGFNGDAIEAECFAYLAVRSLKHLPLSLPSTTGIKKPLRGGKLYKA